MPGIGEAGRSATDTLLGMAQEEEEMSVFGLPQSGALTNFPGARGVLDMFQKFQPVRQFSQEQADALNAQFGSPMTAAGPSFGDRIIDAIASAVPAGVKQFEPMSFIQGGQPTEDRPMQPNVSDLASVAFPQTMDEVGLEALGPLSDIARHSPDVIDAMFFRSTLGSSFTFFTCTFRIASRPRISGRSTSTWRSNRENPTIRFSQVTHAFVAGVSPVSKATHGDRYTKHLPKIWPDGFASLSPVVAR